MDIKEYLLNNNDELMSVVNELNDWNDCLHDLQFLENNLSFFEDYYNNDVKRIISAIRNSYNYRDEYVQINKDGIIVSYQHYEVIFLMRDEIDRIVEYLMEYKDRLYLSEEVKNLIY